MIPMLILYLIRKAKKASFFSRRLGDFKKLVWKLKLLLTLFTVTISFASNTDPNTHLTYNVVRNNHVIGTISINRMFSEDSIAYYLESKIQAKALFKFVIIGKETSIYKDGLLTYSSIFRKVNNKIKANHKLVFKGVTYKNLNADKHHQLNHTKIHRNLVTLFFVEPKGVSEVFCDFEKRMVRLEYLGHGKYKVIFNGGKYNIYHYRNGKCVKIEANSTLFDVDLIPV
ncbi:hypothetical protein KFZ70_01520 [Tamlana fucoidanivorans]|uniref:DUF3108 domain-containing protein n=1 Tax=Allotamlana fucoidanivorans TaxID=2583814 RepID=A0A5C4SL15_9FLAO|nr:DUF6134 family protein [Tamlana fucoidanivorans]TNJ44687.1 hypothetical protein FGF67_08585 [Tamlana fucoidanivorans]